MGSELATPNVVKKPGNIEEEEEEKEEKKVLNDA